MRRRRFERALFTAFAVLWFGGCNEEESHPPPAPTGNLCEEWNCVKGRSPIAAVAVERGMAIDGGACDAWRFSIPAGNDAFDSIRSCGGNQIRCGSSDYRVGATSPGTTLTCAVVWSSKVRVRGHLSLASGAHFEVDGDIEASGGTATISAGAAPDGSAVELQPTPCRIDVEVLAPGTIWANFDCGPANDAATCAARGTFVFESCARESDAG